MIVYNVTLSVHPSIEAEFIQWLKEIHIPEVLECKLFISSSIFKVHETPNSPLPNAYAVQYRLESWDNVHTYQKDFAPALQQKTKERFGEMVLGFRTFLEEV